MKIFNCSKRKIDVSRKIQKGSDGVKIPEVVKHNRSRLDLNKCEHFLDFIFSNELLQDVAYGITKLHFTNGECLTIPHAVVTARYKHIILYYNQFCQDNQFHPLSISSLYRVLKALKPSQRKSWTADGFNLWDDKRVFWIHWRKENVI